MKPFISLARPARSSRRRACCLIAERLEDRTLLSTFSVSNTDDHGPGSLRQAIVDANDNANLGGVPDEIDFDIPGSGLHVISSLDRLAADHRSGGDRRLHPAGFEPEHGAGRRHRHPADRAGRH